MTSDLRTVIDTGVVVSALLLPRSVPRQAFDVAATRGRLLVSDETIAELDDVLRRPKFDKHVFRFTSAVDAHANVRLTGVKSIQIFGAFDNAPVTDSDFELLGSTTRMNATLNFPISDAGKSIWYRFRYLNTKDQPGPRPSPPRY